MSQISFLRTADGVPVNADSAVLTITLPSGATVLTTPITPISTGLYSYDTSAMSPGKYIGTWTFTVAGYIDDVITRSFIVDAPLQFTQGTTLAELERALARRIGPFWHFPSTNASTTTQIQANRLKTTIDRGDPEELMILRRGEFYGGTGWVNPFDPEDAIRAVSKYTATAGLLEMDRGYTYAPASGESIELHYLDPVEQLRYAALEGLRHCYFWDTAVLGTVARNGSNDIDVTAYLPWLTRPGQIGGVESSYISQQFPASRVQWFEPYQKGGHVWLKTAWSGAASLRLIVLRPHFTLVNGETNYTGPNDDTDILHVDREYFLRAGHYYAWINYPELLTPLATEKIRPDQTQVADAFTSASMRLVESLPEYPMIRFGAYQGELIGNLPEIPV